MNSNPTKLLVTLLCVFVLWCGSKRTREDSRAMKGKKGKSSVRREDLDSAIASLQNGTHSELLTINEGLIRTRERKIATADKLRKLMIKNVNEHFKYDCLDLNVQYEVRVICYLSYIF